MCRQPVTSVPSLPLRSTLEISLDGQIFSKSGVFYAILGPVAGIMAQSSFITIRSAPAVTVPPILISTIDTSGHSVGVYDSVIRPVTGRGFYKNQKKPSPRRAYRNSHVLHVRTTPPADSATLYLPVSPYSLKGTVHFAKCGPILQVTAHLIFEQSS